MKTISYGRQDITQDDIDAVTAALKGDYLTQGPAVAAFEDAFKNFVGAKHAIAVTNATAALHIANMALNTGKGSKVITTPLTFIATSNSVLYTGGEVEFADIDSKTFCLDPNKVEDLLKKSPAGTYSGIMPVSFAGYPVNAEDFKTLASKYNLWIIEDGCHAPGAKFKKANGDWSKTGSGEFADLTVFSFHPVKHIATGEGGMITTNNEKLATKLREIRSHGIVRDEARFEKPSDGGWYYEMQHLGYNYRIPDLNCALGVSQLKRIETNLKRRNEIATNYLKAFAGLPLKMQDASPGVFNAYHLFVVLTEKRKELYDYLKKENIYSQIHYIPVHKQPYYEQRYGKQSLPVSESYYSQTLSLPMYHAMTNEEQNYVIAKVKAFFSK